MSCQLKLADGCTGVHYKYTLCFVFLKIYFIYLFLRDTEREAETQAEGEAGSMHREPDAGFNPGSPGSCPGPKAGAKPLRHPGIPIYLFLRDTEREAETQAEGEPGSLLGA